MKKLILTLTALLMLTGCGDLDIDREHMKEANQ
ncbi:MAG: lipoprotein [Ruminococcus sp.]|nr:lipoprotein [Ruminococcus sp.]